MDAPPEKPDIVFAILRKHDRRVYMPETENITAYTEFS